MRDAERDPPALVASRPPSTRIVMNLVAPSPSRTIACASSMAHRGDRGAHRRRAADRPRRVMGAIAARAGRRDHEAVVGRRVAVDGGAVERYVGDLARQLGAAASRAIGASVAMNDSIVAMFGMDHPGALGDAGHGDRRRRRRSTRRDAPLGTVSVVMIALARGEPVVRRRAAFARRQRGDDPVDRQRLHDHAGRERQHFARARSRAAVATAAQVARASAMPRFAGAGVRVAGIDDERADAARTLRARCARQTVTGAAQKRFCVNTPAATVPASNSDQQHVVALPVLDLRGGGAERHARNRQAGRRAVGGV